MTRFQATVAHAVTDDGRLFFTAASRPGVTGVHQRIVAFQRHPANLTITVPPDAGDQAWMHAAERMWMLTNIHPADTIGSDAIATGNLTADELGWMGGYRDAGNRSLCVGDLVLLTSPDGTETAYQALTIGFAPLDTTDIPILTTTPTRN